MLVSICCVFNEETGFKGNSDLVCLDLFIYFNSHFLLLERLIVVKFILGIVHDNLCRLFIDFTDLFKLDGPFFND